MEVAQEMADLLNEYIEAQVLAQYGSWTDVGDGGGGAIASGATATLTVSASNVDDIIRGIKRIIRVANGQSKMRSNGAFIVWRAADFELLEAKPDVGLVKSPLIDLETQKWATGGKQVSPYFNWCALQPERLNMGTPEMAMR